MTTSVVICGCAQERAEALRKAVASVRCERPDEVIVVIDHSPELLTWAERNLPGARVIVNAGAPGLAAARNAGVAAATGDVVAFIDDDAWAEPGWLAALLAPYADPAVVGTGGAVLPVWAGHRPSWLPEEFDWVVGCSYRGLPRERAEVRNVIGCSMSFRRVAILAAGGFDDALGRTRTRALGCEETDLCIRIDGAIVYAPAARVRHRVTAERATVRYFVTRCYAEGTSKRAVARRCGSERALASERDYVARTLPAGVATAVRQRELARAATIGLGLAVTGAGYLAGGVR
jgi:glycosyltransferase involved in cell wall biosynthesis